MDFGYCCSCCYNYGKKIIQAVNKQHNSKLDADSETTTKNNKLNDQEKEPAKNFKYGLYSASYNGCETIAVHNAKCMLGMDTSLSAVIDDFHTTWATFGISGVFGANPYSIGRVLSRNGIEYERVSADEMNKSGIYIVSFWNQNAFTGLHTIAVKYDGVEYTEYNNYGDDFDPNSLG